MSDNYTENPIRVNNQLVSGAKVDVVDLCYSVALNGKMKRLLKNVSFNLDSGNLCALMGPSGAGKSTLLDLIAKRKLTGTWSGDIYINDSPRSPLFSRETAYVLQDDIHISTLTVEETLLYAAWTRLDEGISIDEKQKRVDELLELMGLSHVRHSMVGDPMTKGISGGQLKRLSIAVEIIPLQKLIFLDEPTSGLDSSIALEVMRAVRQFTTKDRTCMTTIHQPSIEVFSLFDKLVLLSAGRLIYFGDALEATNYFSHPEIGYTFEGGFKNPAEFVIEISCGQRLPNGLQVAKQAEDLELLYKSSRFYRPPLISGKANTKAWDDDQTTTTSLLSGYNSSLYATSTLTQIKMLLHRTWLSKIRDTKEILAQIAKSVVVGLIFGAVWWDKGSLDEPLYEDGHMSSDTIAVTSLFFMISVYSVMGNIQAIPYLCSNMIIYRRELVANAYSPLPFWYAMVFTLLPLLIGFQFIFLFIIYFMTNLPSGGAYFFYYVTIVTLSNYCGYATCLALAANAPSEDLALKLFPLLFFFLSTYAGFAIRLDDLPVMWIFVPYIGYLRWTFEGLMINEFNQYGTDDSADDGNRNGNGNVLSDFSFDNFDKNNCIWILFLFIAFLTMILYYGLLPPKNELIKVQNASDVITVLSRSPSIFRKDLLPSTKNYTKGKANDLQEGLIIDGLEEDLVIDDPEIVFEEPMNVNYYRTTTGATDVATGCKVVFRDLTYKVLRKSDNTEVTLLQGVTGRINPGEMCALMGASGAGKSTLLDVLGKRKNTGMISGDITYNGVNELKSFAYVMQDNVHIGILTVRESITYAAELRLKETMSVEKKAKRVQKIIDMLGLTKVAESPLGTHDIRGISGGQLKRVSIGVEIVNLPNLMFLDEPTTGLDSSISLEVMSAVRNLANQNRTVICTIHQPSAETFALFDTLLLLAAGRIIYFGPTSHMIKYFTDSPFQFNYDEGSNPADFVVAVAGSFINACDGRKISGGELVNYFTTTEQYSVTIEAALEQNNPPIIIKTDEEEGEIDPNVVRYNTSTYHQCMILIERRVKVMRRDYKEQVAQLVRNIALGLLYGSIYFQLATGEEQSSYTNRMALLFFGIMDQLLSHLDIVGLILNERLVFYRERGAKAYGAFSYWFSLTLPILFFQLLILPFQTILVYFMAGLRDGHFGNFFLILLLVNYIGFFLNSLSASISSSTQVALSLLPSFVLFNAFYAGFIVYIPTLAGFEGKWVPYIVFYRYAFQGLVLNEFKDNNDLTRADGYLDSLGFNDEFSMGDCIAIIILYLGIFAIGFYLALRFVDFEQR